MSLEQAPFLLLISMLGIAFASFYASITMAKKRVTKWNRLSTYWFVRSNGLTGINNRAKLVWMKRLGYDEAEALVLARYQSQAIFFTVAGGVIIILIAWINGKH
jgi:hypothetical protein